jgi:hypothetical protein
MFRSYRRQKSFTSEILLLTIIKSHYDLDQMKHEQDSFVKTVLPMIFYYFLKPLNCLSGDRMSSSCPM